MADTPIEMPGLWRGLSARLVALTIVFVMVAEVLIYVPSISRYRHDFLQQKVDEAFQATLVVRAAPGGEVAPALARELLEHVGVRSVALKMDEVSALMLGMPEPFVAASYDMAASSAPSLVVDAFATLLAPAGRIVHVGGRPAGGSAATVHLTLDETPLRDAMIDYSGRILALSVIISVITAGLVFLALQRLMVRPVQRMTESLVAFRRDPEDGIPSAEGSGRHDEIGIAQEALAEMKRGLRDSLRQRARLAAVGAAVSKISHDLRNILATAALVSDSLGDSDDPKVRRQAPVLMSSIDRAVKMCQDTLRFARADEPELRLKRFELAPLVDDVADSLPHGAGAPVRWRNEVDASVVVEADRDQLLRVLLNLARNAVEAMAEEGGELRIAARQREDATVIDVADSGPGLPERVRRHLFEAFSVGARGTGLGLAISRELARAHGGELELTATGEEGTAFAITLPRRDAGRHRNPT